MTSAWHAGGTRILAASLAMLAVFSLIAMCSGPSPIAPLDVMRSAWAQIAGGTSPLDAAGESVLWQIRAPRIAAAILTGAALSGAGAAYQKLFRNPLVSPDILGVSSGAALGAVVAIFLSLPIIAIQGFAFSGGLLAVVLVVLIGRAVRGHDAMLSLLLTGVVVGALFGALVAMFKTLADPYHQLPAITFWLLGSLASISLRDLSAAAPLMAAGLLPLVLLRWRINVLSLPDDEAHALGVPAGTLRAMVIASATLLTAAAVAISGVIGWIGLLVPHAARLLVGPQFERMLPLSLVLGAAFMLAVDTLARTLASVEIPPGVLAAFAGAPLFLWLLARNRSAQT